MEAYWTFATVIELRGVTDNSHGLSSDLNSPLELHWTSVICNARF